MKILQVSTSDVDGGATGIALSLHRGYRDGGHESTLAVGFRYGMPEPGVVELAHHEERPAPLRLIGRSLRGSPTTAASGRRARAQRWIEIAASPSRLRNVWRGNEDFDYPATRDLLDFAPSPPRVVHAHNLHGNYFDLTRLPELARRVPLMLTLHDAWLLSGHCAHSFE